MFAVSTTGIYCRPECPARRPRREHVTFFPGPAEAEAAGYRACRRCRPREGTLAPGDALWGERIARAWTRIRESAQAPRLGELAREARVSERHFLREFKARTGVTPARLHRSVRLERLKEGLSRGLAVTPSMLDAGYGALSRGYEAARGGLGMHPTAWRRGGAGERIAFATAPCALGRVLVAATGRGVCAIELGSSDREVVGRLRSRLPAARLVAADPVLEAWVREVVARVEEPLAALSFPLDIRASAFGLRVFELIRAIPPGATRTYGALAREAGIPHGARAIGSACAANPVPVAVPCHRVVPGTGGVGGYRWGSERKRALLAREGGGDKKPSGEAEGAGGGTASGAEALSRGPGQR